jgi:hypothetical protein
VLVGGAVSNEKTFKIVGDDISDGYHTFGELYEHRNMLFMNICSVVPDQCAWRPDFEGWFVLYWESPKGQVSYHIQNKYLPLIEGRIKRVDGYRYDGHTSTQVLERLTP